MNQVDDEEEPTSEGRRPARKTLTIVMVVIVIMVAVRLINSLVG